MELSAGYQGGSSAAAANATDESARACMLVQTLESNEIRIIKGKGVYFSSGSLGMPSPRAIMRARGIFRVTVCYANDEITSRLARRTDLFN